MNNSTVKMRSLTNGNFQVYFTHPVSGKRIRKRFTRREDAQNYKTEIEDLLEDGYFEKQSSATINELMDFHLDKCPDSRVMDRKKHYFAFMDRFERLTINDLTPHDLKDWFADVKAEHDLTNNTLNAIKGCLSHFFNFLVDHSIIDYSPLLKIKFPRSEKPRKPRVFFTEDELKIILTNAKESSPHFLYPLFKALILTGSRRQEIMNLEWSDVDFETNKLTLRDTKNGSNLILNMSPSLRELIEEQDKDNKFIFTSNLNEQIHRASLHRHIQSFKIQYPMKQDWGCHAFRHSFAWNYLKKGGKIHELQALLNHKTLELTVSLYGRIRAEDVVYVSPYDL